MVLKRNIVDNDILITSSKMSLIQNLLQTTTKDVNIIRIITNSADTIYISFTNNIVNKRGGEIYPDVLESLFSV